MKINYNNTYVITGVDKRFNFKFMITMGIQYKHYWIWGDFIKPCLKQIGI